MRIVLVTRVWPTHRPGGMPHVVRDRAVELARQGHDVHVITTSGHKSPNRMGSICETLEEGVHVRYTASPSHEWSEDFARACPKEIAELKPEVVHLESFDRARLWWTTLRDRPLVAITMHGFYLGTWLSSWNGHRALKQPLVPFPHEQIKQEADSLSWAHRVIGTSKWEWRMLRDQYGLSNARLVYDPIHESFFTTPALGCDRTYFLAAAISGDKLRGFDRARAAADAAGVPLKVVQNVTRSAMAHYYDGAIALVLPTQYAQGFDLTISEARSRACPAIMTPTGSCLDEARSHDLLVDLGDHQELVRAMIRMQVRPPAHEPAAERHRPEFHVAAWLAALD